jgi:hypothetical protein
MSVASIIFENTSVWPVAAAALVALTAILLWFYPRQIQDIGLTGWLLPLLRWIGLGALAAMLLRPVLTQPAEQVASGQVLAIVDTSKSMELVDSARTPAERVALARAFGMLPPGATDDMPTRLLSRIRELATFARNVINAQNDLEYARQVGRGVGQKQGALKDRIAEYASAAQKLFEQQTPTTDPAIAQGFAALQSARAGEAPADWTAIQDRIRDLELQAANAQAAADQNLYATNPSVQKICDDLANQNRLALALRALNVDREALSQGASDLRSFTLGAGLEPLQTVRHGGKSLETSSALTDVAAGLGAAESIASEQPARAIVLLTDGHRGGRRSDMASAIRPSGVPVYPVNVAANRISDAWIASISLNTSEVFRGQNVDGQVEVRYQAIAPPTALTVQGSSAPVTFPLQPQNVRDGKPIGNSLIARFSIPISPPPGAVDELLRFSIASEAGEATVENNSAARWIKVYSNKLRVTVITGGPTWDVLNLEHLLQRMPWVQLNAVTLPSIDAHLAVPAALLLQDDILVLHDVPVRSLDPSQWDAVGRMVSDRGGTAIVIAGTGVSLAEYASQPLAAELLPFHDLRPAWRQWPGDTGAFHFVPTPIGIREAMGLGDPADTARRWAETRSTFRYLQITQKNCFSDVNHWLNESDSGTPVIIERPRGAGRLLFVGLDEMWRWGAGGGDAYDQRIWQQMIHFAAGQRFAVSTPDVEFDVGRIAVEPGGSTPVRAWIRNAPSAARSIQVEIQHDGQPRPPLTLTARNGRFEGTLAPTEPGEYQLRLHGPARSIRGPRLTANPLATLPLHVVSDDALGFVNLASDPEYLKRIASASGGHYVTVEQIDELPRLLREVRNEDSQVARKPIYSSPLLLAFVLACLSAEWGLRKRAGLS